jgi:hypothetical protein
LNDDDKAIGFPHDRAGDFEKLDRAARRTDGLRKRGETNVFRVEGRGEIGTVVGSAIEGTAATETRASEFLAFTASFTLIVPTRATALIIPARATAKITAVAALRTLTGALRHTRAGRFARRLAESTTIAALETALATRTILSALRIPRILLFLGPLRTEAESLQLTQIKFVEVGFGGSGILLGGRIVHVRREKSRL